MLEEICHVNKARAAYEVFGDYDADRSMILSNGGHVIERNGTHLWGFAIDYSEALQPPVSITTPRDKPDTWFVWFLYGDLREVWPLIPYELPFIIFAREGKLRAYTFDSLAKRLSK